MPRSSRHKSHKQSKRSSKEAKDYYSDSDWDSDSDVQRKDKLSSKEDGSGSARVLKDLSHSASGEKRKLSSSSLLKVGRDRDDLSGNGNVEVIEEYVSSKRRKDKAESRSCGAGDRWKGVGDGKDDGIATEKDIEGKSLKIDSEKASKSKSSKRHGSGGEKEERNVILQVDKEESRSCSRSEWKRKYDKEYARKDGKEPKEMKEKDRGSVRDKKCQESKLDSEMQLADGALAKKQGPQREDGVEDRQSKRSRENTEFPLQDEYRNSESDKELEKRFGRSREDYGEGDRRQDARESVERRISSRGDRAKDEKYKDERYKDESHKDKNHDNVEKDARHREDANKDTKCWDGGDRDNRYRDEKYLEDGEKDNSRRVDKYREDGNRDTRHKDDKYRDECERDGRHRDDRYLENGERENKHRDDKYREDGDKDSRHHDGGERDDRYRDDKHREDGDRYNEEKHREDYERDGRRKDGKQGDDFDKEKRLRDAKYKDEHASRDRSGDKSGIKHSRDEIQIADLHSRKSSMHDNSPRYDDRASFKDDQGMKRRSDKDDHVDVKSRSTKDQRHDGEKRLTSSARIDLISDRGRSTSRNTDLENRSRHQGSPSSSSHTTREHYRHSKQEEPKYRDYAYEERAGHRTSTRGYGSAARVTDKISSSRVIEKVVQKDDSHLVEFSAEGRLKMDARTSPRQLTDKSPSSRSADYRRGGRSDIRRNIDIEESGQRSGGSRDAKDYPAKESRGIRDSSMEMFPVDDLSQADGDNLSVSSPLPRTGNLSGSSKSLLPPFRTGIHSPLNFGSSEDDSRVKLNTRYRRISDPNMGRVQGSPWKAAPSWPSPMANGYIPFQHGPPPVGFHPVMQQFPAPPIFGVRPSIELNHPGLPYHIPDTERFPGHGRPMGWRNPVDDSYPSPLHGWDGGVNAPFGDESHIYGRPDWDPSRTISGGRGWDTSVEMWKAPKSDDNMELPFTSEKESRFTGLPVDIELAGQAGQQAQSEQIQAEAEIIEIGWSSDALKKKTPENAKATSTEVLNIPEKSEKDDRHPCHVYFSKLEISADLTDPELYNKCTGLLDLDEKIISDSEDGKTLYVEEASGAQDHVPTPTKRDLSFALVNYHIFQKAMMLYKKCREELVVMSGENTALARLCNKIMKSDQELHLSENNKAEQLLSADGIQPEDGYLDCNQEVKPPVCIPTLKEGSPQDYQKLDGPAVADIGEKSDKIIMNTRIKEELVDDVDCQEQVFHNFVSTKNVESSTCLEQVIVPGNSMGNELASDAEEQTPTDSKCGSLLLADVSSKACEVVMPDSIESGSVNLSWIHHSPENTH